MSPAPIPEEKTCTRIIHLEDMRFFAGHGVHPSESVTGHWFRADVSVRLPGKTGESPKTKAGGDRLEETLDYEKVYAVVSRVMATPRPLLETLAGEILEGVRHLAPDMVAIRVRVAKLHPPFPGPCGAAAVEMAWPEPDDRKL